MRHCLVSSMIAAATAVMLACGGGGSSSTTPPPAAAAFALNVGGPAVGDFAEDKVDETTTDSTICPGGTSYTNADLWAANPVDLSLITTDAPPPELFQTERYGPMTCTIPDLTAGKAYKVTLYNTEAYVADEGARLFSVNINGQEVMKDFDIYKEAGDAQYVAIANTLDATADANGKITIEFVAGTQSPKLCGIKVVPAP